MKDKKSRQFYDNFGYDATKKLVTTLNVKDLSDVDVEYFLKTYAKLKNDEENNTLFYKVNPRGSLKLKLDCREIFDPIEDIENGILPPEVQIQYFYITICINKVFNNLRALFYFLKYLLQKKMRSRFFLFHD